MTKWKLTDAYEMGYEYECPVCGRHIAVKFKGKDLPDDCPYCGSKMTEATTGEAIRHFEYGVSHDIFSEPVTSYAKMAIAALREQPRWISVEERLPEPDTDVLARRATGMDVECYHEEAGGYWSWDEYSGKWRVTHWMPLPEGPEVEV